MNVDWSFKLDGIKSSTPLAKKRAERVSIGANCSLRCDDCEVPYKFLPKLFECVSTRKIIYKRADGSKRTVYTIEVGNDKAQYHKYSNGDYELTYNGVLHCSSGPARRVGGTAEYYRKGTLHNEIGPAIEGPSLSYFLDGRELELLEFIENSPQSTHSWGCRNDQFFTVAKLGEFAVVRGLDGTVALLKKSEEPSNIDDLVLDLIGARVRGYKVTAYHNVGSSIAPLYRYFKNDRVKWECDFTIDKSSASYQMPDGSSASLSFDKNTHILTTAICLPNDYNRKFSTNFGFDQSIYPVFPKIEIYRDLDGHLHREGAPAISLKYDHLTIDRYYIRGFEVSGESAIKYDPSSESIIFKDSNGNYHSTDGPAIVDLSTPGMASKLWFEDGKFVRMESELINSQETAMSTYTDLTAKQDDRQNKFEEALKRVAKRASDVAESSGDKMGTKTTKYGDPEAMPHDSRFKQVTFGAKLGLQKAALRIGSQKVAEKIVEAASPVDNVVVQRIVQLALLFGTAELAERLPNGAASKIGLTEDRREGYGGLARYVAGETLGRDAVEIVSFVAPMLLEKLQGISAEEIAELTTDAAEVEALESSTITTLK